MKGNAAWGNLLKGEYSSVDQGVQTNKGKRENRMDCKCLHLNREDSAEELTKEILEVEQKKRSSQVIQALYNSDENG